MQIEIGLGNRIWVYEKQYEAVKNNPPTGTKDNCDICALRSSKMVCYYMSCLAITRHDGVNIHFEEVES